MPKVIYIVLCIVLVNANSLTYLPLMSICFDILKLMGRLTLGWGWIIVAIILDIIFEFDVPL